VKSKFWDVDPPLTHNSLLANKFAHATMYTTRHHLQSLSMSRFEDVTLLSHSLSPSTPTIETWRLTRFSPQGSVQLVQQSDPADKIFLVEPPFEWPPSNDRHVDAIKVLLGVLPDCEGWFLVKKVLRDMFCVKTAEEARKREVRRVTEWVERMWQLSVTERKTVLDVVYRVFGLVFPLFTHLLMGGKYSTRE